MILVGLAMAATATVLVVRYVGRPDARHTGGSADNAASADLRDAGVIDSKDASSADSTPPPLADPSNGPDARNATGAANSAEAPDGSRKPAKPPKAKPQAKRPPKRPEAKRKAGPRRPRAPRGRGAAGSPEAWTHDPFTIRATLFGINAVANGADGSTGTARVGLFAPVDQRYLVLAGALTWSGREPSTFHTVRSEDHSPTVRLSTSGKRYGPLGRIPQLADLLNPFATAPIPVEANKPVDLQLVFLLPRETREVQVIVGNDAMESLVVPDEAMMRLSSLAGIWRRAEGQIGRIRAATAMQDAAQAPSCRLMRAVQRPTGSVELALGCGAIQGSVGGTIVESTLFPVTLRFDGSTSAGKPVGRGWLRPINGGDALLLYFVEDGLTADQPAGRLATSAVLFERDAP